MPSAAPAEATAGAGVQVAGEGAGAAAAGEEEPGKFTVDLMDQFFRDPNMQQARAATDAESAQGLAITALTGLPGLAGLLGLVPGLQLCGRFQHAWRPGPGRCSRSPGC